MEISAHLVQVMVVFIVQMLLHVHFVHSNIT